LLRPFLEGKDLQRWRVESQDLWVIYIPKESVLIDDFPAIRDHLAPYRSTLEQRATVQAWFETQRPQVAYQQAMTLPRVLYPIISQGRKFSHCSEPYVSNDKTFFVSAPKSLAALLNSSLL